MHRKSFVTFILWKVSQEIWKFFGNRLECEAIFCISCEYFPSIRRSLWPLEHLWRKVRQWIIITVNCRHFFSSTRHTCRTVGDRRSPLFGTSLGGEIYFYMKRRRPREESEWGGLSSIGFWSDEEVGAKIQTKIFQFNWRGIDQIEVNRIEFWHGIFTLNHFEWKPYIFHRYSLCVQRKRARKKKSWRRREKKRRSATRALNLNDNTITNLLNVKHCATEIWIQKDITTIIKDIQ